VGSHKSIRHFSLYHFFSQLQPEIAIYKAFPSPTTNEMTMDIFTKSLPHLKLKQFWMDLGMASVWGGVLEWIHPDMGITQNLPGGSKTV
jgi:hypothetical protein